MFDLLKKIILKAQLVNQYFYTKAAFLLFVTLIEIAAWCMIPLSNKYFFNMLETKQSSLLFSSLSFMVFTYILLSSSKCIRGWLSSLASLDMRIALTKILSKKWITSKTNVDIDNPDQRIADDAEFVTKLMLSNYIEIFISLCTIGVILYESVLGSSLLLLALIYIVITLGIANFFRNILINREIAVQSSEATFRRSLVEIHQNCGDFTSKSKFVNLVSNVKSLINVKINYNFFYRMYDNFMGIVPYIILVPMYLNGGISLADVTEMTSMFCLLVSNATIIVVFFPDFTSMIASWRRIVEFHDKLYPTTPVQPFNIAAWIDSIKMPTYNALKIAVVLIVLIKL